MTTVQILKIGGNQIDDPDFLAGLVAVLRDNRRPTVLVHGGGKEIARLQAGFQLEPRYVDGLRVTDEASLKLVMMVLCGAVNPRLVALFNQHGILAQGLSGLDQGLLRAEKRYHPDGDLGQVGDVVAVKTELLAGLLAEGVLPVIAPICGGVDGHIYNVNADHVAGAVGAAMGAERVVFLTNTPGVLQDDTLIPHLTAHDIEALIAEGVIRGGMIPKVETALAVVRRGAKQALITDLAGVQSDNGTIITMD